MIARGLRVVKKISLPENFINNKKAGPLDPAFLKSVLTFRLFITRSDAFAFHICLNGHVFSF